MTEVVSPRCSVRVEVQSLGPRDMERDSRFRGRYAKHEIFADNGRRHFPRQSSPNPLNLPEENRFSPRALSPPRSGGVRSQVCASTPDLFNESSGAWSPRRRSQSPHTDGKLTRHSWATGVPGASPEDRLQNAQQHLRTPTVMTSPIQGGLSSSSMKELLRNDDPLVQDLAAQMALTLTRGGWSGKRCDPKRSTSPGVSAALFGCDSTRSLDEGLDAYPHRSAVNDLGTQLKRRCPNQVDQISTAVGRLLAADQPICDDVSVVDDVGAEQHGRRNRAARPYNLVDQSTSAAVATLLNVGAPQVANGAVVLSTGPACRKGTCSSQVRTRSPFAVEEEAAAACALPQAASSSKQESQALTEIARSCLQLANLRTKAEKLHLRDMDGTRNQLPSGGGNGAMGSIPKESTARSSRDDVPFAAEREYRCERSGRHKDVPFAAEREYRCERSGRHKERLLQDCKDQVAAALANIVAKPVQPSAAMVPAMVHHPLPVLLPCTEVDIKSKTGPLCPITFGNTKLEPEVKPFHPSSERNDRSPSPKRFGGFGGA